MSTAVSATTAAALPLLFPFLVLLWVLSMVQIAVMVLLIHTPFVSLRVFDFFVVVVVIVMYTIDEPRIIVRMPDGRRDHCRRHRHHL